MLYNSQVSDGCDRASTAIEGDGSVVVRPHDDRGDKSSQNQTTAAPQAHAETSAMHTSPPAELTLTWIA